MTSCKYVLLNTQSVCFISLLSYSQLANKIEFHVFLVLLTSLVCLVHVRFVVGRLPKEVIKWRPLGRRKRGRPKLTLTEGIRGLMGEKGFMEEDWNDRSNWRKKIL